MYQFGENWVLQGNTTICEWGSVSLVEWWDVYGVRDDIFLFEENSILARLETIKEQSWKNNIRVMLQHIPENLKEKKDNYYCQLDGWLRL